MTLSRLTALAALAAAMTLPAMAVAQESPVAAVFLHPNGCVYAQSAPQGAAPMWHYVINGKDFFPSARSGDSCPPITQPVPGAPSVY